MEFIDSDTQTHTRDYLFGMAKLSFLKTDLKFTFQSDFFILVPHVLYSFTRQGFV